MKKLWKAVEKLWKSCGKAVRRLGSCLVCIKGGLSRFSRFTGFCRNLVRFINRPTGFTGFHATLVRFQVSIYMPP